MGDAARNFEMKNLIPYSDDLINLLKSERDSANLSKFLEQFNVLVSQSDADFKGVESSILGKSLTSWVSDSLILFVNF